MGFASAGGGLGAFLFPFIISLAATAWGIRIGYAAFVPLAAAVLGACIALTRSTRGRGAVAEV